MMAHLQVSGVYSSRLWQSVVGGVALHLAAMLGAQRRALQTYVRGMGVPTMAHKNRSGAGPTAPGAKAITTDDGNGFSKQSAQEQGQVHLQPDLAEAKRFLAELAPGTEKFTFQTFDDNQDLKRSALVSILHGTFAEHADELIRLNAAGAGIFVTINVTDLQGRKTKNIIETRAAFSDLDGAPAGPGAGRNTTGEYHRRKFP